MIAGRLIRQGTRDNATCADCGHVIGGHRERAYGSPGYEAAVFHCAECDCVIGRGTAHLTGAERERIGSGDGLP